MVHVRRPEAPNAPFLIFFDLDGVLADYEGAARKLGLVDGELWRAQTIPKFYRNLPPLGPGIQIVKLIEDLYPGSARFLTAGPDEAPDALGDKVAWLYDQFPEKLVHRRYIITGDKGACGIDRDMLIDDHTDWARCNMFPGKVIQFDGPHQWDSILVEIARHADKYGNSPLR